MARRKQVAIDVPATREEARQLASDYVAFERATLRARIDHQDRVDALKRDLAAQLDPIAVDQAGRFARLKAWWEAGGKELAGSARSAELGGAKLGIRLTPPAVKLKRGIKADAIVAWLRSLRWTRAAEFVRVKVELDKPAVIKAVLSEQQLREKFITQGLTVEQADEFFIDTGLDEDAIRAEATANIQAAA